MRFGCHRAFRCFVPPHITDELAKSQDPQLRQIAIDSIRFEADAHATREISMMMPMLSAIPSPDGGKHRLVYDMAGQTMPVPGKLIRGEGDGPAGDPAVDEAYEFSGVTYELYEKVYGRNSLDDQGMKLISSVHYGHRIQNAFWNGFQMTYGDGDGDVFLSFTRSLDVVAHELTHGVVTHTSNLAYRDESGALNESFADVMSAIVTQWHHGQDVKAADWLMGDELAGPRVKGQGNFRAFRVFDEGKGYENHAILGSDPQPKHIKDKVITSRDNGGVHINSGIPNHAFYRTAQALGGNSWEKAGKIWYETLRALHSTSSFQDCAIMAFTIAAREFGIGSLEQQAVAEGWDAVGIPTELPA